MNTIRSRGFASMAENIGKNNLESSATTTTTWQRFLPSVLRWIPTSTDHIINAEKRLLSIVKTPYVQEQVNIGSGPPDSRVRWFRSSSNEPRFINTVTFDSKDDSPTLVMVHGYAASQGFFFRNFDALASRFRVIAMDQLGWGGSSRPDFTCRSTEETEAWFVDSFEEWRKAKNLTNFILLGHSFGGYVASKYAIKHPEHVQHLVLVGPAGFSSDSERITKFLSTWKGSILNQIWESNFTPQQIIRGLGPWGPDLVRRYTSARFVTHTTGEEAKPSITLRFPHFSDNGGGGGMYRTAAKRLLCGARYYNGNIGRSRMLIASSRFSTSETQSFSDPHSTNHQIPVSTTETPNFSDSTSSSSSSSSSTAEDARRFETPRSGAKYQDEQTRLLQASLSYVIKLGWTEAALIAGARDVGLSPSIVGSLRRKEAALVEFFMDDCLQRLIDRIDSDESLKNLTQSDCISKLIRIRLEMQAPYISTWPQALSIQAQPANVPMSFKQRAMLVDEIWHAAGDNASDIDWYAKRTVLGGIYSTTEIYMLKDSSPDFRDTWAFLDARVKDAFDLKKTIQEAQYLAEAVSAGLGNSFQGFVGKVFRR